MIKFYRITYTYQDTIFTLIFRFLISEASPWHASAYDMLWKQRMMLIYLKMYSVVSAETKSVWYVLNYQDDSQFTYKP